MKKDITSKLQDLKNKEVLKFDKFKVYEPLSDDITILSKLDDGSFEPVDGDIEVLQITGMLSDDEVKNLELSLKENLLMDTSLNIMDIKRGQILWLTALLQKKTTTQPFNSQTMGVVKVRVVDYFVGLNKLRTLKK